MKFQKRKSDLFLFLEKTKRVFLLFFFGGFVCYLSTQLLSRTRLEIKNISKKYQKWKLDVVYELSLKFIEISIFFLSLFWCFYFTFPFTLSILFFALFSKKSKKKKKKSPLSLLFCCYLREQHSGGRRGTRGNFADWHTAVRRGHTLTLMTNNYVIIQSHRNDDVIVVVAGLPLVEPLRSIGERVRIRPIWKYAKINRIRRMITSWWVLMTSLTNPGTRLPGGADNRYKSKRSAWWVMMTSSVGRLTDSKSEYAESRWRKFVKWN